MNLALDPERDGRTIEEPALFNQYVTEFPAAVENGRWGTWSR